MKHDKRRGLLLCLAVNLIFSGSVVCRADSPAGTEAAAAWEEDYTDTNTEKGTLAVRGEVFEGFQGQVTVCFEGLEGGRTFAVTLDKARDYMKNLSLTGETYRVADVTALSGLREYDCHVQPVTVEVQADEISILRISVTPNSVRKFPEETEPEWTEPVAETKTAEPEEQTEPAIPEETPDDTQHQGGVPILGILGLALGLACAGSLIYIQKREK